MTCPLMPLRKCASTVMYYKMPFTSHRMGINFSSARCSVLFWTHTHTHTHTHTNTQHTQTHNTHTHTHTHSDTHTQTHTSPPPPPPPPLPPSPSCLASLTPISGWDLEFCSVDRNLLFMSINTANFFNIKVRTSEAPPPPPSPFC
jgi:hypothetical protein